MRPVLITGVGHRGGLPVGAGGQHAPVAGRAQDMVAQKGHTGRPAAEPAAERRGLQGGIAAQQPLQGRAIGVLEGRDVLIEQGPGFEIYDFTPVS